MARRIARLVSVSEPKIIKRLNERGEERELITKEVEVHSGADRWVATAFENVCKKMDELRVNATTIYEVDLSFKVATTTRDGETRKFNRVTLENIWEL